MKNYLAFYGSVYYPSGGMADFIGDYDTLEEAIESINQKHNKCHNVNWDCNWANVWSVSDRIEVYTK